MIDCESLTRREWIESIFSLNLHRMSIDMIFSFSREETGWITFNSLHAVGNGLFSLGLSMPLIIKLNTRAIRNGVACQSYAFFALNMFFFVSLSIFSRENSFETELIFNLPIVFFLLRQMACRSYDFPLTHTNNPLEWCKVHSFLHTI